MIINRRNTVQKSLILDTVRSMTTHPTADDVFDAVSEKYSGIGRATVYRVLKLLSDEGLIRRVSVANAPDRFDLTVGSHAHCLCKSCGRIYDFDLPDITLPDVDENGFVPFELNVMVRGVCRNCRKD